MKHLPGTYMITKKTATGKQRSLLDEKAFMETLSEIGFLFQDIILLAAKQFLATAYCYITSKELDFQSLAARGCVQM